jgi:hypothetical protein
VAVSWHYAALLRPKEGRRDTLLASLLIELTSVLAFCECSLSCYFSRDALTNFRKSGPSSMTTALPRDPPTTRVIQHLPMRPGYERRAADDSLQAITALRSLRCPMPMVSNNGVDDAYAGDISNATTTQD